MLNISVAEVILNEPSIRALIGERETASVAEHVGMGEQRQGYGDAAHMVRLIGYSQSVVESALDNLTRAGLIQVSPGLDGIGLFKFIPPDTPARHDSLEALIKMGDRRNGRN